MLQIIKSVQQPNWDEMLQGYLKNIKKSEFFSPGTSHCDHFLQNYEEFNDLLQKKNLLKHD